jgi:hypothetical protein
MLYIDKMTLNTLVLSLNHQLSFFSYFSSTLVQKITNESKNGQIYT